MRTFFRENEFLSIFVIATGAKKYTFDLKKEAELLDKSVEGVLSKGIRTADLLQKENQKPSSTKEVCDEILNELNLQL